MSAFAALKGWKKQVSHMMEKERLPFSLGIASVGPDDARFWSTVAHMERAMPAAV